MERKGYAQEMKGFAQEAKGFAQETDPDRPLAVHVRAAVVHTTATRGSRQTGDATSARSNLCATTARGVGQDSQTKPCAASVWVKRMMHQCSRTPSSCLATAHRPLGHKGQQGSRGQQASQEN